MEASTTSTSAPCAARQARSSIKAGAMAQLSRLTLGAPVAAAWKAGSM
jgi:hypothetical protein